MKKLFLFALLTGLFTASAFSQNNFEAVYSNGGTPDFLNICGDADLARVTVRTAGLSSATRTNVRATVQLFAGVELLSLDPATTAAGVTIISLANRNRPVLGLPNMAPGGLSSLQIGLNLTSDCSYVDSISKNNLALVFDRWTFSYAMGASANLTETDATAEYRNAFKVPVFTLAVDNSAPPAKFGDCYSRSLTMANSALAGFVDTVVYRNLQQSGVSIRKIYVGGIEVPITKSLVGQDTLVEAIIWGSWIQTATKNGVPSDGDVFLEPDESLVIREDICLVSCVRGRLSRHTVGYGCKGNICHIAAANGFARLGEGQPNALISNVTAAGQRLGYCKKGLQVVRFTNNGVAVDAGFADMRNVEFQLGIGQMIQATQPGFRLDSMTMNGVPIFPLATTVNLANSPFVATNIDGAGGLEDLDGDGFFDDLRKDASVEFRVWWDFDCSDATSIMQDSVCLNNYNASWNAVMRYDDPCKIRQTKTLPNFGGVQHTNEEYMNCIDPDAFVNDTFFVQHVETRGVRTFEKACNGQEFFKIWVVLPQGVQPVLSAFKILKNNSTASLLLKSSELKADTFFTYWDATSPFIGGKFDIRMGFIPDCSTEPGQIFLPFGFGHECPPCACSHTWYCDSLMGPIFHTSNPPCPAAAPCALGLQNTGFSAERTTFGFSDLEYTIPFPKSEARKDIGISCDSVQVTIRSTVGQTPLLDSLGAIVRYDNVENLKDSSEILLFGKGRLKITHGGQNYFCSINSSHVKVSKTIDDKSLEFDFSSCIAGLGFALAPGDEVVFVADFSLNPTGPYVAQFRKIPNFRGWNFATVDGQKRFCDSYGANFFIAKNNTVFAGPGGSDFPRGCSASPLQYRLVTINNGFRDFFGDELRASAKVDSLVLDYDPGLLDHFQDISMDVSLPGHPTHGSTFYPIQGLAHTDNGHFVARFDTLLAVPALNNVQSYAFNLRLKLTPTCESSFGSANQNNVFDLRPTMYFTDRYYAKAIPDGSCAPDTVIQLPQKLTYTLPPDLNFESITNPNLLIEGDTAIWDIKQCNISTQADARLTWIAAEYDSTELEIFAFENIENSAAITPFQIKKYGDGKRFALTTQLLRAVSTNAAADICNTIRVKAKVRKCGTSGLRLSAGWNCAPYPQADWNPDAYEPCQEDTIAVQVTTLDPSVDATIINQPNLFPSVCDTVELEVLVRNTGQGRAFDVISDLQIPLVGARLLQNSIKVAWPSNAPLKPVLGQPTFVGNSARGQLFRYTGFDSLDLNLKGAGLPGFDPIDVDSTNEFVLKYAFVTDCDFVGGSLSFYAFSGKKACDDPTNSEAGESLPILFSGLQPPANKLFGVDLVGSAGAGSVNLTAKAWNLTSAPTDAFDRISVKLPVGTTYLAGSSTPAPTILTAGGLQILSWPLPVGLGLNDTASIAFSVQNPSVSACGDELEAAISTLRLFDVSCAAIGQSCQMGTITTDGGEKFLGIVFSGGGAFASGDTTICAGGIAQLVASGAFSDLVWSPSTTLSDPTIANPQAAPTVTTTYLVQKTDATGCISTDEVTVRVLPAMLLTSQKTDASCGLSNGSLAFSVAGGSGNYSFVWSPSVSTSATASNLAPGAYEVTVTDLSSGCTAMSAATILNGSTTFSITLISNAATSVAPSSGSILVGFSGGATPFSINWAGPSSGSMGNVSGSSFLISNLLSGNYSVTATDKNGCQAVAGAFVPLTVINNISLSLTATPDTSCCLETGQVAAIATGGDGSYSFAWSPAVSASNIAAGLASGFYTVTVTDGQGLTASATVFVDDLCFCDFMPDVAYEPAGIERFCLPIPYILRDDAGIAVNGVPYTGPFNVCDLDTVVYYGFGFTPGKGLAGPYRLDTWTCNQQTFSNVIFNDIFQLEGFMNAVDPFGFWIADPDSRAIYGGDIDQAIYGPMKVTDLTKFIPNWINPSYTQFAYGTEIFIQPFSGKATVVVYDSLLCCTDSTCVIFINPCEDLLPTEPLAAFSGAQKVCLDIPFAQSDSMLFFIDRLGLGGNIIPCDGGNGTEIQFNRTVGEHELIVIDLRNLCADTVALLITDTIPIPLSNDRVDITLFQNEIFTSGFCNGPTGLASGVFLSAQPCGGPENGVMTLDSMGCMTYAPDADFLGQDSACVTFCNPATGACAITFFHFDVVPKGVTKDTFFLTTPFATPIPSICAQINEIANAGVSVSVVDAPGHGVLLFAQPNCISYWPTGGFFGKDTTIFRICNAVGDCDTTVVFITVQPPTQPTGPKKDTLFLVAPFETPVYDICNPINEIANVNVVASSCGNPAAGELLMHQPNCASFWPAPGFSGQLEFCLKICNSGGQCDTTIVFLTVLPKNQPPGPEKDSLNLTTTVGVPVSACIDTTQLLTAFESLTSCSGQPAGGIFTLLPNSNCFSFQPSPGFVGTSEFCVVACDAGGICDTTIVFVNVQNPPPPSGPKKDTLFVTTPFETPKTGICNPINEIANVNVMVSSCGNPSPGSMLMEQPNCVSYWPPTGFVGQVEMCFRICNSGGECDTTVVFLTVLPKVLPPVLPDLDTLILQTPMGVPVGTCLDTTELLTAFQTLSLCSPQPPGGNVLVVPSSHCFGFQPSAMFVGAVEFCLKACDATGICDTTIVLIQVTAAPPPPSGPQKDSLYLTTNQNVLVSACVDTTELATAFQSLQLCSAAPSGGQVGLAAGSNCFDFTPANGFLGTAQFCVVACDGTGVCDSTIVFVEVKSPVQPPSGPQKDSLYLTTNQNVLVSACVDTTELATAFQSLQLCSAAPSGGQVGLAAGSHCFDFTPANGFLGTAQFCVVACDGTGVCDSTIVFVEVKSPVQPPLLPQKDSLYLTTNQNVLVSACVDTTELATAFQSLQLCSQPPAGGQVGLAAGSHCFDFTPANGFLGTAQFCVVACDGTGVCDSTIVFVEVKSPPPPPGPKKDTLFLTTTEDILVAGCVDTTDLTAPFQSLGVCEQPENGAIGLLFGQFCFTYQPAAGFFGQDTFCLVACGQNFVCDTTIVVVTVNEVPDPPVILKKDTLFLTTEINQIVAACADTTELPGAFSSLAACGQPQNGSLQLLPSGPCFGYSPDLNFVGVDSFCVLACDAAGNCDTTIVFVLVETPLDTNDLLPNVDTLFLTVPESELLGPICLSESELDGPATVISWCQQPPNGLFASPNGAPCLNYQPDANFVGLDAGCVVICDADGDCDTTILIILVTPEDTTSVPPPTDPCGILPAGPQMIFIDSPGQKGEICLPVPLDSVFAYDFFVDGQQVLNGFSGCDFDTAFAYTYFTIPNAGALGPYRLDYWVVGQDTFSGIFQNIEALVDSMNLWDAPCVWSQNSLSLTIVGGCVGSSYGDMKVTQLGTQGIAFVQLNQHLNPLGTLLKIDGMGQHEIVLHGPGGCEDTLLVNVLLVPQIVIDTTVWVGATDELCFENFGITLDSITAFEITCPNLSGNQIDFALDSIGFCLSYAGQAVGQDTFCIKFFLGSDSCVSITVLVTALDSVPCSELFDGKILEATGASCDTVEAEICLELPFLMLQNFDLFDGGQKAETFECTDLLPSGLKKLGIRFDQTGPHFLILNSKSSACADTAEVRVLCDDGNGPIVLDTIPLGESDTLCLGGPTTILIENICPDPGGVVVWQLDTVNFCLIYTGTAVGSDSACIVLCDSLGVCDTTIVVVVVDPPTPPLDSLPPVAVRDERETDAGRPILLDPILNDTLHGVFDTLFIRTPPEHGTAQVSGDQIVYTPAAGYCDSNDPDSLEYVLCNRIGCDTAWIRITVLCDSLIIFDGFSPNGDDMNEVFFIEGLHLAPDNDLTIFNRWGNQVYQAKPYRNEWNGRFEGKMLPDGVYFYLFYDGKGRTYRGPLVILR